MSLICRLYGLGMFYLYFSNLSTSAIQFLSRFDIIATVPQMTEGIVFLMIELPLAFGKEPIYTEQQVEKGLSLPNFTRYVSRLRTARLPILNFLSTGIIIQDSKHNRLKLFPIILRNEGTLNFEDKLTFAERWPVQMELITLFKASFILLLLTILGMSLICL